MNLSFTVKSLGKKRPLLNGIFVDLDIMPSSTVRQVLEALVVQQVEEYNLRKEAVNLIDFLQKDELAEVVKTGSVRFNEQYNREKADVEKAIGTVIQGFEDGMIALFLREAQLEDLNEVVRLNEGDSFVILRLTFLAGSIW